VAKDVLGEVARLPLPELATLLAEMSVEEAEDVLGHHLRRQTVRVHLVRVAGEDAVGPDGGAPLHRDPPSGEKILGERPDGRVAEVEPVAGGVEGKTIPDVGSAQPSRPGLALQEAIAPLQGQSGR
jgi:hypothetical protein